MQIALNEICPRETRLLCRTAPSLQVFRPVCHRGANSSEHSQRVCQRPACFMASEVSLFSAAFKGMGGDFQSSSSMQCFGCMATICRNILPPSSGLNMETLCFSKTLACSQNTTRPNTAETQLSVITSRENFKLCVICLERSHRHRVPPAATQ